jgi:hypothetical protein
MRNCPIDSGKVETEQRKPKPFNKKQKSLIEQEAARKHRRLKALSKLAPYEQAEKIAANSQRLAQYEEIIVKHFNDVVKIDPSQYDKIRSWLAAKLNYKADFFNTTSEFNVAGEVRDALANSKRIAENILEDAGKYRALDKLDELNKRVTSFAKQLKIDRNTVEELLNELVEVGSIPTNNMVYGNSEGVKMINARRYSEFVERAQSLGFTDEMIEGLRNEAATVHQTFDEVRIAAEALGHEIEPLQNLGYFPRVATNDFKLRLRKELKTDSALTRDLLATTEGAAQVRVLNPLTSVWQKSRTFNYYVPNSVELVATIFNETSTEIYRMLLDSPKEWAEFLSSKATPAQVDTLFESGVLDKLPMTSREVFEYMVDEHELPYKYINEMFKQNPGEAITEYVSQLKKAVGNSAMVTKVISDGMHGGWALTGKQVSELSPELKKNFVKFQYQNIDNYLTPAQIKAADGIYVHRVVSDQWLSMLSIAVNPIKLSNIAKTWAYIANTLNKSTLLARNILYVGQNFLGGVAMSHAAGANLSTLPHAMFDVFNYYAKGHKAFDSVKPFAKIDGVWMSKQEFFRSFMLRRGSDATPGAANISVGNGFTFQALDPRNGKRALEYLWSYADAFKDPFTGTRNAVEYFGNLANNIQDEAFHAFAESAKFIDTVMKWNAFQSLVERQGGAKISNQLNTLATGELPKVIATSQELQRYVDDYFFTFDDPGTITRGLGQYVRPFSTWAMTAPPAVLRHVLRKPGKFMAYNRLMQISGNTEEAGLTDWQDDDYMITLRRDKNNGEVMALFPSGYDPVLDFVQLSENVVNTVASVATGKEQGNQRSKRKAATEGYNTVQAVIDEIFKSSYYSKPVSILTGTDVFTGEKRDNTSPNRYLGVPVPPIVEALLGMYTPIDALNRANPGEIFGRKEYKDARGNVVVAPKDSVFGYSRTDSDTQTLAWEKANVQEKVMMVLGAKVRLIDTARNTQMTLEEITKATTDLRLTNVREQKALAKLDSNSPEFKTRYNLLQQKIQAEFQLRYDLLRLSEYARVNKIPPKMLLRKIEELNSNVGDLPMVGSKDRIRLIEEMKERIK